MSAATIPTRTLHAAKAARKDELHRELLIALRLHPRAMWCEPIREKSLILAQLDDGRALVVVVKLRGIALTEEQVERLLTVNANNGVGLVMHDPADVDFWLRKVCK